MKKAIEKDSEEWKIFQRIYKFYSDYAIPEEVDEYWDSVVKEIGEIEKQFDNPLAGRLAVAVAKALQDIAKGEK